MARKQTDEIASGALAPGSQEQRRALLAGEWDFSKAAEATTPPSAPTWLLYQHDDGRYAVAPSAQAATFAHGDPAWHRVCPVEVHGDTLIEGITPENRHAEAWPAHSKSEYKRRVAQGDPNVLPPAGEAQERAAFEATFAGCAAGRPNSDSAECESGWAAWLARASLPAKQLAHGSHELIDAADRHADNYEGQDIPARDVRAAITNAFYAGSQFARGAKLRELILTSNRACIDWAQAGPEDVQEKFDAMNAAAGALFAACGVLGTVKESGDSSIPSSRLPE